MESRRNRILIVDDEAATTRLLQMNLEHTGRFEVRVENNPNLVVAVAAEFQPEVIILDVVMPGMDGGDVAAALKEHPSLCNVPVIFLTATIRKAEVDARGGVLGGYPFLAKPASTTSIIAMIEAHLAK